MKARNTAQFWVLIFLITIGAVKSEAALCPPSTVGDKGDSSAASSRDPNALTGPAGYGDQHYVPADTLLAYRIDFENDSTATAPAQQVDISNQLAESLDWSSFQLTEIGFGDTLITVPPGNQTFETAVSMTYNDVEFEVQINAGIDPQTGVVTAHFYSIDPETGWTPPVDVGFLPPEDGTYRGMGHVNYIINHVDGLAENSEIRNIALIIFDMGEQIYTNQIDPHDPSQGTDPELEALVTIDSENPQSSMASLPETSSDLFFVSWSGEDSASGIAGYDIYTRDGNELEWTLWLGRTTDLSAEFIGTPGHTHEFYSVAIDNVGHREAKPVAPETKTFVESDPDGDGVLGSDDNCPYTPNSDQIDTDGDSQGDACDTDDDGDTIDDADDNCPLTANEDQLDTDSDATGDACDDDDDNDNVSDLSDNCPTASNPEQLDTDTDSLGDVCDDDDDNDQVTDATDNCPLASNADQTDSDGDGAGDACDTCPQDADNDIDADGLCGNEDNCPAEANPDQTDLDLDGLGDICDPQTCGNEILEGSEICDDGNMVDWDGCSALCISELIVSITKAEVEWDDAEIKVKGEIALPLGASRYDIPPQGTVAIELADLGPVVDQSAVFSLKGAEDKKWEHDSNSNNLEKFHIDWQGSTFDYKETLHLKANHIGQASTSLEIDREGLAGAFSIQIENVTIHVGADNSVVTVPDTLEVDADDSDGEIEVELPFALLPRMVITVSQPDMADTVISAADYSTSSIGTFDMTALFDPAGTNGLNETTYFKLNITLGEVAYPGLIEISSGWKTLKEKEWKFQNN